MHHYLISGLHVSCDLFLPGAIPEPAAIEPMDVSIRRGGVPMALEDASQRGPNWEMAEDRFLLSVPRLARFLITAGCEILVDIDLGVTDRDAAGFVLGTAFGILLHQRGALVLHGSAVARDGRAVAICGASGAGKSTLAAALCEDGCTFVTDDICVVGLNEMRQPVVLPDGRQLKLWKTSIDKLDLAPRCGDAVRETFEKYYIEPAESRAQPTVLSAIYVLCDARPPFEEGIEALALPDSMRMLEREAYRPSLQARMGLKPQLIAQAAAMFGHARAFRLIRPRGFEQLRGTVAMLRAHWESLHG